MAWRIFHLLITAIYFGAPVGAVVIDAIVARRRGRSAPRAWLVGVVLAGVIVGTTIAVLYAVAVGGKVRVGQAVIGSYFAIGMLLILRGFDWLLLRGIAKLLRIDRTIEKPTIAMRLRV